MRYEPSAQDFLSPVLGEADLLRRVMPPGAFGPWLSRFLPVRATRRPRALAGAGRARPIRTDGKFAHLDGLNLSRAWMLDGIVSALPADHPLVAPLAAAAARAPRGRARRRAERPLHGHALARELLGCTW